MFLFLEVPTDKIKTLTHFFRDFYRQKTDTSYFIWGICFYCTVCLTIHRNVLVDNIIQILQNLYLSTEMDIINNIFHVQNQVKTGIQ